VALTRAIEANYALYGITVDIAVDDKLERDKLASECISRSLLGDCQDDLDPDDGYNRYALGKLENKYHDDQDRLHMVWGSTFSSGPVSTEVDKRIDHSRSSGHAYHVGSPTAQFVSYLPRETGFGVFIGTEEYSEGDYDGLQSTAMHELGHALSIGWADDAPIPIDIPPEAERFLESQGVPAGVIDDSIGQKAYEVYSGSDSPSLAGGVDDTPEKVRINGRALSDWSIMSAGTSPRIENSLSDQSDIPVYGFSAQELRTVDADFVPSRDQS